MFVFGYFAPQARAATITVTATADDLTNNGNCTLREAIKAANTNLAVDTCSAGSAGGSDTIVLGENEYALTLTGAGEDSNATGDLDITSDITIQGGGRDTTIIDSNDPWDDRIIDVRSGGTLTGTNFTVAFGNVTGNGGGILNAGTLSLTRVDVSFNAATGNGGGIENVVGGVFTGTYLNIYFNSIDTAHSGGGLNNGGTVTLNQSFVWINDGGAGGGIHSNGTATIQNTTIAANDGYTVGGITNTGSGVMNLDSDTITNNTAAGAAAGGIGVGSGTVTMQRTIVANNTGTSSNGDCGGSIVSGDYNLLENSTCTFSGTTTHHITGVDPILGSLDFAANGTGFYPIGYGSPAADAAGSSCLAVDVADTSRPQRSSHIAQVLCDIGAYEFFMEEIAPIVSVTTNLSGTIVKTPPLLTISSNEDGKVFFSCSSGSGWPSGPISITANTPLPVQLTSLVDGLYTCQTLVSDAVENIGYSSTISFTIDTVAPTLTVVTPVSTYTNNPSTVIRATENVSLTFTGCSGNSTTASANTNTTINLTVTGGDGRKFCSVTVSDAAGNAVGAGVGDFYYDTTAPTLALTNYLDRPQFVSRGPLYDYGAVAYDKLSGVNSSGVRVTRLTNGTYAADGKHYGTYRFRYDATDKVGNVATPIYRTIYVHPKMDTIAVSRNSFTLTKPDGSTTKVTPFGLGNTVEFVVRRVLFSSRQEAVYVAMMIGQTRQWQIKFYDYQGKEIKNFASSIGKKISTLTLPAEVTANGINWTAEYSPTNQSYYLALGSKNGTDVPRILELKPSSARWRGTVAASANSKGNVLVKFLSLDNDSVTLVTSVNGKFRLWKVGSNFREITRVPAKRFTVTNGTIGQKTPEIFPIFSSIGAASPGQAPLNFTFDSSVTMTIKYGTTPSLGQSETHTTASNAHYFPLNLSAGQTYYFSVYACKAGTSPSSSRCITSAIQTFQTL